MGANLGLRPMCLKRASGNSPNSPARCAESEAGVTPRPARPHEGRANPAANAGEPAGGIVVCTGAVLTARFRSRRGGESGPCNPMSGDLPVASFTQAQSSPVTSAGNSRGGSGLHAAKRDPVPDGGPPTGQRPQFCSPVLEAPIAGADSGFGRHFCGRRASMIVIGSTSKLPPNPGHPIDVRKREIQPHPLPVAPLT